MKQRRLGRAFARLASLRSALIQRSGGYVSERQFYRSYREAVEMLKSAGHDVGRYQLQPGVDGDLDQAELILMIDEFFGDFGIQASAV